MPHPSKTQSLFEEKILVESSRSHLGMGKFAYLLHKIRNKMPNLTLKQAGGGRQKCPPDFLKFNYT